MNKIILVFINAFLIVFPCIEGFKTKTGLKYDCNKIVLECSEHEKIWVRKTFLVALPSFGAAPNETNPSQKECSINYGSLLNQPYCDITDAVMLRCFSLSLCEISLPYFHTACSQANLWSDIAVIVDDFICLPKATKDNIDYMMLNITSIYSKNLENPYEYFYFSTPDYPSLWWFPEENIGINKDEQQEYFTPKKLSACFIKFTIEQLEVTIIDFRSKSNSSSPQSSIQTGIPKIDSNLNRCFLILSLYDSKSEVKCIEYDTSQSYIFIKSNFSEYSQVLIVFKPTTFTKLNLLVNIFQDKNSDIKCNTQHLFQTPIESTTVSIQTTSFEIKNIQTKEPSNIQDIIIGASLAAVILLLLIVTLVACITKQQKKKKNLKKNVMEPSASNTFPGKENPAVKVRRKSTFLQAFKPINVQAKNTRNIKKSCASYYSSETFTNRSNGHRNNTFNYSDENCSSSVGLDNWNPEEIKVSAVVDISNVESTHTQPPPYNLIDPKPLVKGEAARKLPFSSHSSFSSNNDENEYTNHRDTCFANVSQVDLIKSKLQNIHKKQSNNNINLFKEFSPPTQFDTDCNLYVDNEDIYANASEI